MDEAHSQESSLTFCGPKFRIIGHKSGNDESSTSTATNEDEPNADLSLLKIAASNNASQARRLDATPLKTSIMREKDLALRRERYKQVKIRFKFPHEPRLIEATFESSEPLMTLYRFLEYLFGIPPQSFKLRSLRPVKYIERLENRTLFDDALYPASLLHVFMESDNVNSSFDWTITNDFLARHASLILEEPLETPVKDAADKEAIQRHDKKHLSAKIPQWLRLSKKK